MLWVFLLKSPNTLFFFATISLSTSFVALFNVLSFPSNTFNDLFMLFIRFVKDVVVTGVIFSNPLKLSVRLVTATFISFALCAFVVCVGNFEIAVVMLVAISLIFLVLSIAFVNVSDVNFNFPIVMVLPPSTTIFTSSSVVEAKILDISKKL